MFLSFFAAAVILPALLVGVNNPGALRVLTNASEETKLRLWFEPDKVVTSPGQVVRLKLVAEYDDKNKLLPKVEVMLAGDGVSVKPDQIVYPKPFVGRVVLSEVTVTAKTVGSYQIRVVDTSVNTGLPNLEVETDTAEIAVLVK